MYVQYVLWDARKLVSPSYSCGEGQQPARQVSEQFALKRRGRLTLEGQ